MHIETCYSGLEGCYLAISTGSCVTRCMLQRQDAPICSLSRVVVCNFT